VNERQEASHRVRREVGVTTYLLIVTIGVVALFPRQASAQGCIVARSAQQTNGPGSQAGYLEPHHFDLTIDYRHQYSFRHYVGDVEQTQRIQMGNEVENRINLQNFQLTYQATPRWSFGVNLPLLFASRRAANAYNTPTDLVTLQSQHRPGFTVHKKCIGETCKWDTDC
jgi:hypothetical protein